MSSKIPFRFQILSQTKSLENYEIFVKLKPIIKTNQTIDSYECVLSGVWFKCELNVNEIIHIFDAKYDNQLNRFIVDNDFGFIVKSPEVLISSTTLMSANYCMRKSWLSIKFRGWTPTNPSMLIGNIVHQLFQDSCRLRLRGIDKINELFLQNINRFNNNFYALGLKKSEVIEHISKDGYIQSIAKWMENYFHKMSSINGTESDNRFVNDTNDSKLQVLKVRDIEDSIWNTKWGLKGNVDLTIDVVIDDKQIKRRQTMPLELKTGKASFSSEHIGQVGLYTIIMEDMTHTNEGLLLYLKDKPQMRQIITKRAVKRDLIQLRNDLVKYLNDLEIGPKPLNNYHICSKCDHLFDCALTLQTLETQNLSHSSVMSDELIPKVISHLSRIELDFFKKWISLLNLEYLESKERNSDSKLGFWNEPSDLRESKGLCFAKLTLLKQTKDSVVFIRSHKFLDVLQDFNLSDNLMRRWERVALSIDNDKETNHNFSKGIAISLAFIKSIDRQQIELILDKSFDSLPKKSLFRIDHMSNNNMISSNFTNILRLMDSSDSMCENLRHIIISHKPITHINKFKRQIVTKGKHILKCLNQPQQRAVLKALSTDSYVLLRGMPGAGKTQTIVALVRLLVVLEQSVLITSYTHSAVDNILLKLKCHDIDFLRIGAQNRIDESLHSFADSVKTASLSTVEELENYYSNVKVVASTCLGVTSHPIFTRRKFDYCIVDEASQVLLPTCLGPLFHCNRFILVGDPKQLPPVVQSESAKQLGLEQSLFILLQNDTNTTNLTIQYRMNSQIMRISNELTYDGILKCGSTQVSNSTLSASDFSYLTQNNWLTEVMRTDLSKSVVFLDTDQIPALEIRDSKGKIFNEMEAKIAKLIIQNFLNYFNIKVNDIGVISPYQRQVQHLKEIISIEGLEINTIDQYQGRDKDLIIYSCVKSNSNESNFKSEILNDERRLNVGVTRAKKKFILIGSKSTLNNFKPFYRMFAILRSDQILSVPKFDFNS